jgi:hypothetical protein
MLEVLSRVKEGKCGKKVKCVPSHKGDFREIEYFECTVFGESKKRALDYHRLRNLSKEVLEDNLQSLKSQP